MKTIVVLLIIVGAFAMEQSVYAQEKTKNTARPTLDVEFEKSDYVLLEPVFARFKFLFPATETLPRPSQDTAVKITSNGKTKHFTGLTSAIVTGGIQRLPNNRPDERLESHEIEQIIDRVHEFFPEPGNYQVRFILNGVTSDSVEIGVSEPQGRDKEAFDFLTQNHLDISFDWVWKEKTGIIKLEEFVERYGDTVYGDFAIKALANVYLAKGEISQAKIQFERISSSKRKAIAEEARKSLSEIESRLK